VIIRSGTTEFWPISDEGQKQQSRFGCGCLH
jgi:hypothetical protein